MHSIISLHDLTIKIVPKRFISILTNNIAKKDHIFLANSLKKKSGQKTKTRDINFKLEYRENGAAIRIRKQTKQFLSSSQI